MLMPSSQSHFLPVKCKVRTGFGLAADFACRNTTCMRDSLKVIIKMRGSALWRAHLCAQRGEVITFYSLRTQVNRLEFIVVTCVCNAEFVPCACPSKFPLTFVGKVLGTYLPNFMDFKSERQLKKSWLR